MLRGLVGLDGVDVPAEACGIDVFYLLLSVVLVNEFGVISIEAGIEFLDGVVLVLLLWQVPPLAKFRQVLGSLELVVLDDLLVLDLLETHLYDTLEGVPA